MTIGNRYVSYNPAAMKPLLLEGVIPRDSTIEYLTAARYLSVFQVKLDGQDLPLNTILNKAGVASGLMLLVPRIGAVHVDVDGQTISAEKGDVLITSVALEATATANALLGLGTILHNETFARETGCMSLSYDSIAGQLIHQYLTTLARHARNLDETEALPLARILRDLVSTASQGTKPDIETSQLATQKFEAYVQSNLSDHALSPDTIARELGMSRATLYRLTEPYGGVTNFIQAMRLEQAREEIRQGALETGTVTQLVHDLGFGSEATFRRQFKNKFGMSPRDAAGR